jgi:hypothetical protein
LASGVSQINFNGGEGNDRFIGGESSARTVITGGNGNDSLFAGRGDSELLGGTGSDVLVGGVGNDRLTGVDSTSPIAGRGEIDFLVGNAGRDRFHLGQAGRVFYDDGNNITDGAPANFFNGIDGTGDFARVIGFRSGEDVIQLAGRASDYVLKAVSSPLAGGSGVQDIGIFRKNGPTLFQPDELIAVVQDVGGVLNLNNSGQFQFA